ncbi:MAG: nickel pincer cofactor biosynthesis protein LarC [Planctomycetota bacterium]|nr:nickel pincer cofactor biosynthesis protein LarC [Planctomycetota bacterium]
MIGYLDMPSGISGDMFLGCLVDAGWTVDALRDTIDRLGLPDGSWRIEARSEHRRSLRAILVDIRVTETDPPHRTLGQISETITRSDLPAPVRERAVAVFERLARAEAAVHGADLETVHFHEVGAMDAIIDIVGVVAGLHALHIETLYASSLPLGAGWVDAAHGALPLPAPATLELLAAAGAPTCPAPGPGELVTPTGAALVAEFAAFSQPLMQLERIAVGCGRRELDWPNLARLWLGQPLDAGPMVQIETNIDDMNPQFYADVAQRLFDAGAADVWLTPVQMKKNRPAVVLSVLAPAARELALVEIILRETTTLGLRVRPVRRHEARREMRSVDTAYGAVTVKLKWLGVELIGVMPEYDDCRRLAERHRVPVRLVHEAAAAAAQA